MRWRGWRRPAVAIVLLALSAGGCSSRRSHADVVAAAAGASGRAAASSGSSAATPAAGVASTAEPDLSTAGAAAATAAASGAPATAGSPVAAGSQPADEAAATAPGAAGTRAPIRLGVVGTLSGVAGASLAPQADGVRIWARWINDRGGVNGHPVEIVTGDDGGDPSRHLALVQEFVEQKRVLAFVGDPEALTGAGSVAYLTKAGVPDIGSDGAGQWFYQSPVYFPEGSHGTALGQAALLGYSTLAKARGLTKVATITCVEAQVCRDSFKSAKAGFARYGMQVVYQSQNSLGQPDFTAECLNARSNGAQFLSVAMDANSVKNIARSCARQAYHPLIGISSGQTTVDLKDDPELDGMIIASVAGPWFDTGTPGVREFAAAAARYAPGTPVAGGDMIGWASAKIFELAAKATPEPLTSKALIDHLQAIHGDPLPDIAGTLLYNRNAPATPSVCIFTVVVRNKSWTSDGKRACGPYDPNL